MSIRGFDQSLASVPRPNDPEYDGTWREAAVGRRLLPVYSDWIVAYAIDEEGQLLYSEDVTWRNPAPLTNARHRHIALAQAALLYPDLAYLRPERQPEDPTCPSCRGAGGLAQYPGLVCECGNIGWIPAGSFLDAT